jgi:hypothetical protein
MEINHSLLLKLTKEKFFLILLFFIGIINLIPSIIKIIPTKRNRKKQGDICSYVQILQRDLQRNLSKTLQVIPKIIKTNPKPTFSSIFLYN